MTKYCTTPIIVIFLCGFLGHTISQENVPNAEEVLNKVSGVIDLNSLNVSNILSDMNNKTSVVQMFEETSSVIKQKCEKYGGEGAYENAMNATVKLEQCLTSFVNFTQLEKEMEQYKPTGDLDIVFKRYCQKTPILKQCVRNFTTGLEPCLEAKERENKEIIQNITNSLLNFVCYKEGDRIALFIAANGPECLRSKQQETLQCINSTLGNYMPQLEPNSDSLKTIDSLPFLVLGNKECTDMSKLQTCVVKELEKCSDPTPANIVDSIFNFIRRVTPCQNLVNVQNAAASNLTVNLLIMSIVFFSLRLL
ncbi:hypothetical protein K0M31_016608 [Melipona bicolor]|uniref:27 kDa hemolymph protein n=1 Tax=Melipona bicolor TaxID=60889 RepID=A0AA40FEJ6_9HYME|nr:hypothetical protein K0M31_016608 [Melipona bicolor]